MNEKPPENGHETAPEMEELYRPASDYLKAHIANLEKALTPDAAEFEQRVFKADPKESIAWAETEIKETEAILAALHAHDLETVRAWLEEHIADLEVDAHDGVTDPRDLLRAKAALAALKPV
jgi:DNA-binding GntR family transcriptional regulator